MPGGLLERETELARIDALVDVVRHGEGALGLVEGAAGIGKTRLLEEACARAREAGLEVLRARGVALEHEFAFGVVRQLFERPLAAASPSGRREMLGGAAALAGALLGFLEGEPTRPVADATFANLHGLYWLMFNLSARRPLVIAIDDAHWADTASLRFVSFVAARLEGLPALLLLALRPGEPEGTSDVLAAIRGEASGHVLTPAELSEHACGRLVDEAFGDRSDAAFSRACREATGGNPFYLTTLVEGLRADGVAPDAEGARLAATQVPATVVRALVLRLSRLPPAAAGLARALAVLGPDAELRDATSLAGLELPIARVSADELARAGILAQGWPMRFMHPIIQAAIYADLPPADRSGMHLRAAKMFAELGAGHDRVASHLLATEPIGDPWVVRTLRAAAADAMARGVPESAVSYLVRARAEDPPPGETGRLLHELGVAEFVAGRHEAVEHMRYAMSVVTDVRVRAEIASDLGKAFTVIDRFPDAVAVLERAIDELAEADNTLGQALEAQLLGAAALHLSTRPAHRRHLGRLRDREFGESPTERQLLANLALWTSSEGARAAVVKDQAERALAGGKLLTEAGPDSQTFYAAANALVYVEEFELARFWYDQALAEARGRGSLFGFAMASAMRSECEYRMGDLPEAEADARAAMDAGGPGHWVLAPVAIASFVLVLIERGDFGQARDLLAGSRLPHGLDEPGMTNWLPFAEGHLSLATGQWDEAASCFLGVGAWLTEWGERDPGLLDWRTGAALALRQLGDAERARELSEDVISLGRELGKPRAHGVGLRAAGVIEDSVELLREAVGVLAGSPARLEHARALVDLGAALRRQNHRKEAREPLREGVELARRCGGTALVERGQTELIAAGARPRRVALSGVEALTPSQRRVAALAVEGLSAPEIAQRLFVTVNTVESHLRHVYIKLGIHSRNELATALVAAAPEPVRGVERRGSQSEGRQTWAGSR